MKLITYTLVLLTVSLLFVSQASAKPIISVCIPPQAFLVKAIGGDSFQVNNLVAIGLSPCGFIPLPRQVANVSRSVAYLAMGVAFEKRLLTKLQAINPQLRVLDISIGVPRRMMVGGCTASCCLVGGEDALDPYTWLCPRNMILMAPKIRNLMKELDPENATKFIRNCSKLIKTLQVLDREVAKTLLPVKGKNFYVYHPAFGYFADRYGLKQVAIEVEGKEPSARQLAKLVTQARKEKVRTIYIQKQFARRSAHKLAAAIGATVEPLDPLDEDYVANMRNMAKVLAEGLATK